MSVLTDELRDIASRGYPVCALAARELDAQATEIAALKLAGQQALEALHPYRSTVTRGYTKVDAAIDALRKAIA